LNIHQAFKIGAKKLAQSNRQYSELHKSHGIEESHWKLLTQDEYWTPDQARQIRSIIASVIEVSMTIAGMPAVPLPGQYAAALIAEVVSPANRMLACMKCPDTFDAFDASGVNQSFEVKDMPKEQMMALVLAYSGGYPEEPQRGRLPKEVEEEFRQSNKEKA
jgi:3-deoxy-D-arabino-heptulosonate 7-phosphate (DAHP) synthase class II